MWLHEGLSLVVEGRGSSLVTVYRPLSAVASLVEQQLQGMWASGVAAHGLRGPRHVESSWTGDRTSVLALEGFLTAGP